MKRKPYALFAGRTKWTAPDGSIWKRCGVIARAYCLHVRAGIFAEFAVAWQDSPAGDILMHLAPSNLVEVRPLSKADWMLPAAIKTGCFARLVHISNDQCGLTIAEPLS